MTLPVAAKVRQTLQLRRALALVWQSARGWTLANLLLILIQALFPLAALYLLKLIVDAVATAATANDPQAWKQPVLYIGLAGGLAVIRAWTASLAQLVRDKQGELVIIHLHNVVHRKSAEADLASFENPEYYNTLHRAQKEVGYRPTSIVNGLVQTLQSSVSFLGVAGLLAAFHWGALLAVVLLCVPEVWTRIHFANRLYRYQLDNIQEERKAWFYHRLLTTLDFAKELRLFRLSPIFMDRFLAIRRHLYGVRQRILHSRFAAEGLSKTLALAAVYAVYVFVALSAIDGKVSVGDLVMYFQAFQQGQQFFQEAVRSLAKLYEDNLFLSGLYDILDLERQVREPDEPLPFPTPLAEGIVIDNVSFTYPDSPRPALNGVSMTLAPGRLTALVGENGSGKTTLVKLLCRLYDVTEGTIRFDSTPMTRLPLDTLRRNMSVIFQDYVRYPATAGENIWFGDLESPGDMDRIRKAAQLSGAAPVLEGLPGGYEAMLTKWLSRGCELSVGEWQKVALARALYGNSPVLVLDEPTSAMDSRAEYDLYATLEQLAANRIVLLISHRLTTIKAADYIYVMDRGRVAEHGVHRDLISNQGVYARLFDRQDKALLEN